MAKAIEDAEGRFDLHFRADGRRIMPGGRGFYEQPDHATSHTAFTVIYPFRPSVASCDDMVAERQARIDAGEGDGLVVTYDQERWDEDPRIDEQAGMGELIEIEEMLVEAAMDLAA
jgi:hypothetical protein